MKRDNRGLSLVELIVAFAILAIVGIAITGFMAYSSRGYASSNRNTKLQYEQQIVENHIRDNVMETTKGISFDSTTNTLTLLGGKLGPSSNIEVSQYRYVEPVLDGDGYVTTPGKLYYLHQDSGITATKYSEIEGQLDRDANEIELTDTMAGFDFDLSKVENEQKVLATLTFKVGDTAPITVYPEILLRNRIKVVGPYISGDDTTDTDLDEIYDPEEFEVTDKVASVVIKREDHTFSQGETDTISMAGNSTSVHYEAVVTKKSTYMGTLSGDILWSIVNKDNFKSDWATYISLTDGTLAFRIVDGKGPEYAMNGQSYIILRATYREGGDLGKYGQIRVVVNETGGIFPETISSTFTSEDNVSVGTLDYQLGHTIRYTNGTTVTGDDVYNRIKYTVKEEDGTPSEKTISPVGKFIATKSMEDKTYIIEVLVTQRKKDGDILKDTVTIKVGKVPDKKGDVTVPVLGMEDEILRNKQNPVNAFWSDGVPSYDNGTRYHCWYEIEIEPVKLDKTDSWYDIADNSARSSMARELTTFYSNSYKNVCISTNDSSNENNVTGSKSVTLGEDKPISYLYVKPFVDWKKTFAVKVTMRAKLSKSNGSGSAQYYMLTEESENNKAILTSNKDDAYTVTKVVKMVPVTMKLTPVDDVCLLDGSVCFNGYYYCGTDAEGAKNDYIKCGYPWTGNYGDYNGNSQTWSNIPKWGVKGRNYYGTYYKMFIPQFTGIHITTYDFPNSLLNYYGWQCCFEDYAVNQQGARDTSKTSLRRYTKNSAGENVGANVNLDYYDCKIYRNNQSVLIAYLEINGKQLRDNYTNFPDYVEWSPVLKDTKGNWVEATHALTKNKKISYYTKKEYESKRPQEMN